MGFISLQTFLTIASVIQIIVADEQGEFSNSTVRGPKALSVFQVVRFPNIACVGSSSLNGTCYTSSECTNKGGTSAGSCASGFGVCCTFTLGCGSVTSENCTYFQSTATNQPAGQCGIKVCKCSSDICQLRMDFSTFIITGPSTIIVQETKILNGQQSAIATVGAAASFATECLTDTFTVTGNGNSPGPICGTNSGYHMYVDASASCNLMTFQLGPTAIGTTLATRQWNIKISQISCYSSYLPPPGCTQYFTGTSGILNSFNYANSVQLAYQQQTICMRRERGYCRICYSPTSTTDFQISSVTTTKGFGKNSVCCAYGTAGLATTGYDCVVIPGAVKTLSPATQLHNNHFCGNFGLVSTAISMTRLTVCSYQVPFQIQFLTDAYTFIGATAKKGFKIAYYETTC